MNHRRRLIALASLTLFGPMVAAANPLPGPVKDSDFHDDGRPAQARVELGKLLFHDKILSGNRNISCATCHHALAGTGDGLSLPVGEGGAGLSVTRDLGTGADAVVERVPRNAPPVFNLGAREFSVLFHDGRLAVDPTSPGGFRSPAGDRLPPGLDSVLAAQAMFPVQSGAEMAGQPGENPQADAAAAGRLDGPDGVWAIIADRLRAIPEYVELFQGAFPDIGAAEDITYVHAANAIAAFEAVRWRFDDTPFDRHLRGERGALSRGARAGMRLFYGKAGCSACHSGPFQTDHGFHSIAMPQIGPGKGDGASGHEDFGRERESADPADRFRFRTPTLRNVALSGPWGHAGAYGSLRAVVEHHLDPLAGLYGYDPQQAALPSRPDLDAIDRTVMEDPVAVDAIAASNDLRPPRLSDRQIDHLLDFLHALTDPAALDLRGDVPMRVPSGLPVFD